MKKRWIIIMAGIIVVSTFGFLAFGALLTSKKVSIFKFKEIKRGDLEILVSSTGTVNPVNTVEVGAEVSGTIKEVYVDFNDRVEEGDLLAIIDPVTFEAAVKEARASVLKAQALMEKAKAEYEKKKELYEKGYISELDFLTLKTDFQTAEADLLSAKAKLEQAERNLQNTRIKSPIKGIVIERAIDRGQTIAASLQAPELFIIAEDLNKMQIEALVDENDIGQIKKGQKVRFTVQAYPDRIFEGYVQQIRFQPETTENVVNYPVIIDVSNQDGLLFPGMTATIDFIVVERKNVLLVPNSAISIKPSEITPSVQGKGFFVDLLKKIKGEHSFESPVRIPPVRVPEGMKEVFYLDDNGFPQVAFFKPGQTDGIYTEVLESPTLKEGMKIITGIITREINEDKESFSIIPTPRRPERGPMGGGPF